MPERVACGDWSNLWFTMDIGLLVFVQDSQQDFVASLVEILVSTFVETNAGDVVGVGTC
jgi:hypothetical protein